MEHLRHVANRIGARSARELEHDPVEARVPTDAHVLEQCDPRRAAGARLGRGRERGQRRCGRGERAQRGDDDNGGSNASRPRAADAAAVRSTAAPSQSARPLQAPDEALRSLPPLTAKEDEVATEIAMTDGLTFVTAEKMEAVIRTWSGAASRRFRSRTGGQCTSIRCRSSACGSRSSGVVRGGAVRRWRHGTRARPRRVPCAPSRPAIDVAGEALLELQAGRSQNLRVDLLRVVHDDDDSCSGPQLSGRVDEDRGHLRDVARQSCAGGAACGRATSSSLRSSRPSSS